MCRKDIGRKDISIELLCNIKPFEWSEINGGERFDAIIGNPPYVKTEDIHTLESEIEFAIYKKVYKSAYKQFDKYFLFLEKAFNLLKEDGKVCYIVPNKFYKIGAGKNYVGYYLNTYLKWMILAICSFFQIKLFIVVLLHYVKKI